MSQEAQFYQLCRGCRINREGHGKLDRLATRYMDTCVDGMHIDLDFEYPTPLLAAAGTCWLHGKLCGRYQRTITD